MRTTILILLVCLTLSVTANMRAVRSAHAELVRRIKRQGGRGTAANDAMECLNRCQPILQDMSSNEEGSDLGSLETFMSKDRDFNPDDLPNMCSKFKEAKACFDKCPPNPMVQVVTGAFRPLEYMCVTKYDEFVKYQQCLHESSKGDEERCEQQCGDEQQIASMMKDFKELESERDLTQVVAGMQNVCKFTDCHLTCSTAHITEICGSVEPVQLLRNLMGEAMGMMENMFATMGMADMMPKECNAITQMKEEIDTTTDESTDAGATSAASTDNSVTDGTTISERPNDTIEKTTQESNAVHAEAHEHQENGATMQTTSVLALMGILLIAVA